MKKNQYVTIQMLTKTNRLPAAQRLINHKFKYYSEENLEDLLVDVKKFNEARAVQFGELGIKYIKLPNVADLHIQLAKLLQVENTECSLLTNKETLQKFTSRAVLSNLKTSLKVELESEEVSLVRNTSDKFIENLRNACIFSIGQTFTAKREISTFAQDVLHLNYALKNLGLKAIPVDRLQEEKIEKYVSPEAVDQIKGTDLSDLISSLEYEVYGLYLHAILSSVYWLNEKLVAGDDEHDLNDVDVQLFLFYVLSAFLYFTGATGTLLAVSWFPKHFKELSLCMIDHLVDLQFIDKNVFFDKGNLTNGAAKYSAATIQNNETKFDPIERLFKDGSKRVFEVYRSAKSIAAHDINDDVNDNEERFLYTLNYLSTYLKDLDSDWVSKNKLDSFTTAHFVLKPLIVKSHLINEQHFNEASDSLIEVLSEFKGQLKLSNKEFASLSKKMDKHISAQDFSALASVSLELDENKNRVAGIANCIRENLNLFTGFVHESIENGQEATTNQDTNNSSPDSAYVEELKEELTQVKSELYSLKAQRAKHTGSERTPLEYIPKPLMNVLFDKCTFHDVHKAISETFHYVRFADGLTESLEQLAFKDPKKLMKVLLCICQDYYACIMAGNPDSVAKALLPRYKAKESETTMASPELMKLRQFQFGEEKIEMVQHCTLIASSLTIQIYFKIQNSLVHIGYIGKHLKTAGE